MKTNEELKSYTEFIRLFREAEIATLNYSNKDLLTYLLFYIKDDKDAFDIFVKVCHWCYNRGWNDCKNRIEKEMEEQNDTIEE